MPSWSFWRSRGCRPALELGPSVLSVGSRASKVSETLQGLLDLGWATREPGERVC
jgi:hypothetical protein